MTMTDPAPPSVTPAASGSARRPSVEHLVLGAVLLAVVIGAALWFLHGSSSSSAAAKPPVAAAAKPTGIAHVVPAVAAVPVSPQKAAFLRAGNKICTTMNAQQNALGKPATAADLVPLFSKTLVITEAALTKLEKLKEPAGDKAQLKALWKGLANLNVMGGLALSDLKSGNGAYAQSAMAELDRQGDLLNTAFNAYGLTVCGS